MFHPINSGTAHSVLQWWGPRPPSFLSKRSLAKSHVYTFSMRLRAPRIYQRLRSVPSYWLSSLARCHSEKKPLMLFLLTRSNEIRHRDTMMTASSGKWFLIGFNVFEGSVVFDILVSWCCIGISEWIEYIEHDTQPTGNSFLVISYVDYMLTLNAPRTLIHLCRVLLDM